MSDITIKDIKKAMKTLEKSGGKPVRLIMGLEKKNKIIHMLNEKGIQTKINGKEYVMGMEVITDERCCGNIAYIDQGGDDDA